MAVSGVSSSRSIYGTRNVITGLASGMDTESMIENAVSAYKTKISGLQQKRTKVEWQQEAYRSIINKMSSFSSKYASYMSANNLMSTSFFDQAVKTVAKGKYADKVSATGRASSSVQIDRVLQMASAATYKMSGSAMDGLSSNFSGNNVVSKASGVMDLDKNMDIGALNGSVTLAYGGASALSYLTLNFDETKPYASAEELVADINKQLEGQSVSIGTKTYTGKELLEDVIQAKVGEDGKSVEFADPKGNNVYVSGATGTVKALLLGGQEPSSVAEDQIHGLSLKMGKDGTLTGEGGALEKDPMSTYKYMMTRGGSMEITLDGKTKTIQFPDAKEIAAKVDSGYQYADALKDKILSGEAITTEESQKKRDKAFMEAFQDKVNEAFNGKLTVKDANNANGEGIKFQFEAAKGSTFSVYSSKGEAMGFGKGKQVTSYINTNTTLGDLLKSKGSIAEGKEDEFWKQFEVAKTRDTKGNITGDATDANGDALYSFRVNGKEVGQFNANSTLAEVFNAMNSNSDSEVKAGYSRLTNEITFTAKDTGEDSKIGFSNPAGVEGNSLAEALFGKVDDKSEGYTKGQDAIFEASVNGTSLGRLTRSSNSINMDGMTINLKGTFGYDYTQNYSIKYTTEGGVTEFSASGSDDKLKITSSSGSAVKYTSSSTEMADFNGKEIYGKYVDDQLRFFVDDDKGNTKELYARKGSSSGNVWFSINKEEGDNALKAKVTKGETTATPTTTEAVTFETSSDADKIVDVVKQMVEDYNAMATEIKNAYSTLPLQRSNGAYYEPLTDEDRDEMSESAADKWDENAKTGILFGDRDLASLYSRLTSAVSMTGEYGAALRAAGITVNYSNGLSTLEFNETEFRAALDKDPDKVRDAFTASTDSGAKANGLMQALKQPLDLYGKTSGGKGILVDKAGSPLAASTMYNNTIQKQLNQIDEEIEKWQEKMSDKVDYYTNQFSRLEQLIQQMNSQSSYFSQLMGG